MNIIQTEMNKAIKNKKSCDFKNSSSFQLQIRRNTPVINPEKTEELNKFMKPNTHNILYFFQNHPVQP
jgi:nucleoid DNA-binding protein